MTANQLAYHANKEVERSNRAKEFETNRSNVAKELETNRSNLAKEVETHRANVVKEKETRRTNKANEDLRAAEVLNKTTANIIDAFIPL